MKIPEPLFVVINPVVRLLLSSPLHVFMSNSLLLLTFTGRRSHRSYTTPLRYVRAAGVIRCFTSRHTQWWRNLQGGQQVYLRVQGRKSRYHADIITEDSQRLREAFQSYLSIFPQDADYHDIRLDANNQPLAEDFDRALQSLVLMEARPDPG